MATLQAAGEYWPEGTTETPAEDGRVMVPAEASDGTVRVQVMAVGNVEEAVSDLPQTAPEVSSVTMTDDVPRSSDWTTYPVLVP